MKVNLSSYRNVRKKMKADSLYILFLLRRCRRCCCFHSVCFFLFACWQTVFLCCSQHTLSHRLSICALWAYVMWLSVHGSIHTHIHIHIFSYTHMRYLIHLVSLIVISYGFWSSRFSQHNIYSIYIYEHVRIIFSICHGEWP